MHLTIRESAGRFFASVGFEPAATAHHPSVDVLFSSVAALGAGALGVVLTGMGSDGLQGSTEIAAAGGRVLAESAASCVVYGMPRSVVEARVTSGEAPIDKMGELILKAIFS